MRASVSILATLRREHRLSRMVLNPLLSSKVSFMCNTAWSGLRDRLWSKESKAVSLHAMVALGVRGGIAPTHSRPRH
jgi:hypothetical protein